jgi:hypothetical protein
MKFIDYVASKGVPCATYLQPGVVTGNDIQLCVMKAALGSEATTEDLMDEATVVGMGQWLAKFHEASR